MIKISETQATDCGRVLDAPKDANIEITKTQATRVDTVFYIRDNEEKLKQKILESVVDGTPPEVIEQFIQSIKELDDVKADSVELVTFRTGLANFVKKVVGVAGFAASIVSIITPFLPQG
ncbi:hypothetical protein WAJ79_11625 [Acinetobacter baumannii]|uniref:hypothetical protein n=1 Tax=Acinetobacter baumannii TaxID=470 RepID=UPI0018AFFE53|nr:hypothetical protein [Acinetobacter baumannii]MBF9225335.1 hypothetical protein [Acinetobacter baumannii]